MNKTKAIAWLPLLAACAVSPAGLAAPCSGTNINSTQTWSPSEIVKGVQVSIVKGSSMEPCLHDGGYCVRKDKDGDTVNEEWTITSPGKGTSKVPGGTGKFANASWTYSWQLRPLHGPLAAVRWSGDCR